MINYCLCICIIGSLGAKCSSLSHGIEPDSSSLPEMDVPITITIDIQLNQNETRFPTRLIESLERDVIESCGKANALNSTG